MEKKQIKEMSKDEKSLLLFLETRAVDYGGRVNEVHMNNIDDEIIKKWTKSKFIQYGRIVQRNINSDGANWVKLSDEAFKLAHKERRAREKRMWENRTWISTKDSIEMHGNPHLSRLNENYAQETKCEGLTKEKNGRSNIKN